MYMHIIKRIRVKIQGSVFYHSSIADYIVLGYLFEL
jgi:hypothetical protein